MEFSSLTSVFYSDVTGLRTEFVPFAGKAREIVNPTWSHWVVFNKEY